jgi:predicted DCC family thiol-disulfide oxidoreductase YuxK
MNSLTIYYDNWCPNCQNFIKIVRKLDWLHLILEKELRSNLSSEIEAGLDIALAEKGMASDFNKKWVYGYNSLFLLILRLPIFWISIPLFWVLKISNLGEILYEKLAVNRGIISLHCDEKTCEIQNFM